MHRISQTLASLAVLGLTGIASAAVVVDGYTWDYAYTGDALPENSSPAWTQYQDASTASLSGGELTVDTAPNKDNFYYKADGTEWNPANGSTAWVQLRMKVNSQAAGTRTANNMYFGADGGSGIPLNFGTYGGQTGVFNRVTLVSALDVFQWHTYRFALDFGTDTVDVYVDNLNTPVVTDFPMEVVPYAEIYWADGSGDDAGSATYDYLAWNNTTMPVPEPAALSLLGLGALALRRRK